MIAIPRRRCLDAHAAASDELDFQARPLQAGLGKSPWRVAVASVLLNKTQRVQAERVLKDLLQRYPCPGDIAAESLYRIADIVEPCGFGNRRARTLHRFDSVWTSNAWSDIRDLPGVGVYVTDAVGIFCFGCTDLDSKDLVLHGYRERLFFGS